MLRGTTLVNEQGNVLFIKGKGGIEFSFRAHPYPTSGTVPVVVLSSVEAGRDFLRGLEALLDEADEVLAVTELEQKEQEQ